MEVAVSSPGGYCCGVYVCSFMRGHSEGGGGGRGKAPAAAALPRRRCRTAALPLRCSREGILVFGRRCSSLLNVFPEAMRHLLLPDSQKAPAADTVDSQCDE